MLGKIEGRRRRCQRMRWLDCKESDTTGGLNNNRVCPGVVAEGVAWLVCLPFRWYCVQGSVCSTLLLLQALQKWHLGFLVSLYPLPRICPNCTYMHLVSYSLFVFCCLKRSVSRCKHCSPLAKGSRSQSV